MNTPYPLVYPRAFALFVFEQKLSPRKVRQQRGDTPAATAARTSAAGLGTYEMLMSAALKAGRYDAVLAQADAARAALRGAASSPPTSSGYDNDDGSSGRGGEGSDARAWCVACARVLRIGFFIEYGRVYVYICVYGFEFGLDVIWEVACYTLASEHGRGAEVF